MPAQAREQKSRKKRVWSSRVVVKYALLQVPALALLVFLLFLAKRWVDLPAWFIWGLIALWVAKDVILFPLTWRAYDQDRSRGAYSMVSARGITEQRLAPSGYVRVHGELWKAEVMGDAPPIEKGESIRVQGIRGLTLLVHRDNKESEKEN